MIPSQSVKKIRNCPINSFILVTTVLPNVAPSAIINIQRPILAMLPIFPVCIFGIVNTKKYNVTTVAMKIIRPLKLVRKFGPVKGTIADMIWDMNCVIIWTRKLVTSLTPNINAIPYLLIQ